MKRCPIMKQVLLANCVLLALSLPVVAQNEERLRWQFNAGDQLQSTLEQKTQIETNIDTRRKAIGNDMLLVIDWQIEKVDENSIDMTQSISRIKLVVRRPSKTAIESTTIDTSAVEPPNAGLATELHQQVASLIGTRFNVSMSTLGDILDVSVPESSKAALRQAPASMRLREVLTADGLKELLGQMAIVFPENLESRQWSIRRESQNPMGVFEKQTVVQYQGKSSRHQAQAHTFDLNSSIKMLKPSVDSDAPEMQNYSGTGNAWFAPDSELIYESQFESRMNVARQYRDQKIISNVSTSTQMKVVKKP